MSGDLSFSYLSPWVYIRELILTVAEGYWCIMNAQHVSVACLHPLHVCDGPTITPQAGLSSTRRSQRPVVEVGTHHAKLGSGEHQHKL